ncbi:MAG: hypothetical protein AB1805_10385 [Nitrospirota bacterium]
MLDRGEVREIASIEGGEHHFVSMYLNVDPLLNRGGDYDIHFKNMMKEAAETLDKQVYRKVRDDIGRIKEYVASHRQLFRKGLAIISSAPRDFWRVYHLAVPVRNEIVIDTMPYTKPLLEALDNYERYAVALVEKEDARLFVMHLGEIVEYEEVHTGGVPGKHKAEGDFALAQIAVTPHMAHTGKSRLGVTGYREHHRERHIAEHVKLHLKDVLEKLNTFLERERINRLIVGGSDEATQAFRSMLHQTAQEKIIGTMRATMFAAPDEVLRDAEALVADYERREEERTVERLVTQASKGQQAVAGLEAVLEALRERKVMKLVMLKDLRAAGYACGTCDFVSAERVDRCLSCQGPMKALASVAEHAGEMALQQGATVEIVSESTRLLEAGGIGAFLRY